MDRIWALILFCMALQLPAQTDSVFKIKHISDLSNYYHSEVQPPGIYLEHGWKMKAGDDLRWARSEWNTKDWHYASSVYGLHDTILNKFATKAWYRLNLEIDSSLINKPLVLLCMQGGASEIYLDGKLLWTFGKIDPGSCENDQHFNPQNLPINIVFKDSTKHILAVRYHNHKVATDYRIGLPDRSGFVLILSELHAVGAFNQFTNFFYKGSLIFYISFFIALGILHFMLFFFYRTNRSNLYYSIFNIFFGFIFFFQIAMNSSTDPNTIRSIFWVFGLNTIIYSLALIAMLYSIFYGKLLKIFWIWVCSMGIAYIAGVADWNNVVFDILEIINLLVLVIEPIRVIIAAMFKRKEGAWIIGSGVIITIVFFTVFVTMLKTGHSDVLFGQTGWKAFLFLVIVLLSTISIPLSMSLYLAREFSRTSKSLEKKLIEVEDLSAKNLEQEREKQHMLANQNIILEKQVKERTYEITEQKKIIEEKNKDITDSIAYAKRIQDATLPPKELKYKLFPQAFVLFKPKDIVSGDFYWFAETEHYKFIAAADCTGHGVPGAMVSVVCSNALNRAVKEFNLSDPGKILDQVRELVLETFARSENSNVKDGMDISLCSIPKKSKDPISIQWAGANNPLWYIQGNEMKEITATKQPIGATDDPTPFKTHTIPCKEGDVLYLFSDGYADQFGGEKGKKLKYKQMLAYILGIQDRSMAEQEKFLDERFEEWKGALAQIDDVLVIGVKI